MSEGEIKQIMINGRLIGLVGLVAAIKQTAKSQMGKTDVAIQNILLETVSIHKNLP